MSTFRIFLYLNVRFNSHVSALLDSCLIDSLPRNHKSNLFCIGNETVTLANKQKVRLDGVATVNGIIEGKHCNFDVYVMKATSHSLIIGTGYMKSSGVQLDFSNHSFQFSKTKVHSLKKLNFPANSESVVWGKVSGMNRVLLLQD